LLTCSGADPGQHVPTPALGHWYGTTIGDAKAGSPAGQRQRCSGDVKHHRRHGCGGEEIALGHDTVEDVHEAGQPRHYRWRGQASSRVVP
jgi:hypothetical protein